MSLSMTSISSSISKGSKLEAGKARQASTADLMLTAAVLAVGGTGCIPTEDSIAKQLGDLLQDKAMVEDELNYFYMYKFGFSISAALKFAGFLGKLTDFVAEQKRFSMDDGLISYTPIIELAPPAIDEALVQVGGAKGQDDETASLNETQSTTDADSLDMDSEEVDVAGWHSVGNRLVSALGSPRYEGLDADFADCESDSEPLDDADEEVVDVDAWCNVGKGLLSALKDLDDSDSEDEAPDADGWRSVGVRVLRHFDDAE